MPRLSTAGGVARVERDRLLVGGARLGELAGLAVGDAELVAVDRLARAELDRRLERGDRLGELAGLAVDQQAEVGMRPAELRMGLRERAEARSASSRGRRARPGGVVEGALRGRARRRPAPRRGGRGRGAGRPRRAPTIRRRSSSPARRCRRHDRVAHRRRTAPSTSTVAQPAGAEQRGDRRRAHRRRCQRIASIDSFAALDSCRSAPAAARAARRSCSCTHLS